MADKTNHPKQKRLSKGERMHVRRLKQAARKEANLNTSQSSTSKPVQAHKKQEQS